MRLPMLLRCLPLLLLAACTGGGGSSATVRVSSDGKDLLFTKVETRADTTTFRCLASSSGQCHYLVYAQDCDHDSGATCPQRELQRLVVALGDTRQVHGLAKGFRQCASATPIGAHC